jgi:hypothetical protein
MTAAASTTPWRMCTACGHWQKAPEDSACIVCQWSRPLALSAPSTDRAELRVLVDAELRSDRTWHVTGITTPRVGAAINEAIVLQRLNDDGLRALLGGSETSGASFPSWGSWELFREFSRSLLTDELNSLIRRSWEGLRQPSPARVLVSIRAMLLDPDIELVEREPAPAWLEVVPFDAAAASAAAKLRDDEVTFDVSRTQVSFTPGGDRIEVAVRAPCEMLISECRVVSGDKPLLVAPLTRIVRRDALTALPPIVLSAEAVRGFAANGASGGRLLLSVRGTETRFVTRIPVAALPAFSAVADLFLDLGSTNTKWALRLEGKEPVEHDQDTATLTEVWGLNAYRKADFLSDPTGERWSEWVARALPALRHWVGREHNAYLRNIHLSLPSTEQFDVMALAKNLRATVRSDEGTAPQDALRRATTENLVSQGAVVLVPEHELVAAHYLGVLRILQEAAQAYAGRFENHEVRRADQAQRQRTWDSRQAAVKHYDSRWFWYRLTHDRPTGPIGSRPAVPTKIANPAEWMNDLVEHPEQFDHVVLLDAGGLSLDISVLEKHELVRALSHSDTGCGGEAISSRIGRREVGSRGTRYKAQLGLRWLPARDLSDPAQREYRDATRELYGPVLTRVTRSLGGTRWKKSPHCCVLLTGGGSRNPHLAEYIIELASEAGLRANVVDAPRVEELIHLAREFPEPLQALESEEIRRFEATQVWSARRERQPLARYDKFAVVGGMSALGDGRL